MSFVSQEIVAPNLLNNPCVHLPHKFCLVRPVPEGKVPPPQPLQAGEAAAINGDLSSQNPASHLLQSSTLAPLLDELY